MNNLRDIIKRTIEEETFQQRKQRMLPAAIYGALIASTYVVTLALVNVYTFPGLPLGVDWGRVMPMLLGFAAGAALFGTLAAWFTEEPAGIVGGGVLSTIVIGIVFLLSAESLDSTSTFQSIIMAVTLFGVNMLAAWGLRWTANRHLTILHEYKDGERRKFLFRHIAIILLIGFVPGVFGRMDLNAQQAIGHLHKLLQAAPQDSSIWPQLPLKQVPALENHFGSNYRIYVRTSAVSAGALDVTVRFEDGFTMSCILPTASGVTFITDCVEGRQTSP